MTKSRRGPVSRLFPVLVAAPFLALVLQAAADEWHGRALLPQDLGTRGVQAVLGDPVLLRAVVGSLWVATVVAASAVVIAWPAARYLAGSGSVAGWTLIAAPVLLPPLVLGEGLSTWFLRIGVDGGHAAIVLAHLGVAVPYAALGLVPGFDVAARELDHSAALVGAGPWRRLLDVVAPALSRHLALAFALAFTVSWSQYATSLAVGGGVPMLPLVLVPFARSDPQVAAVLSLLFLVPPAALLGIAAGGVSPRGRRRARRSIDSPSPDSHEALFRHAAPHR